MDAQHVLRGNGDERAKSIGPEGGGTHQDAHADAGNVSTGQVGPLAQINARQNQLSDKAGANGQQGTGVTLKDAVGELAYQQNEGDEERREIAVGGAEESLPRRLTLYRLPDTHPVTHSASLTL